MPSVKDNFLILSHTFDVRLLDVLVKVSIAVIKTLWPETTWEWKGLLHLSSFSSPLKGVRAGTQRGAGTWRPEPKQTEEVCVWLNLHVPSQPAVLTLPGPPAQGATNHSEQRSWLINQSRKFTTGFPTGQSGEASFSVEVSSPKMILTCVKLT